jgi:hypothetical protein
MYIHTLIANFFYRQPQIFSTKKTMDFITTKNDLFGQLQHFFFTLKVRMYIRASFNSCELDKTTLFFFYLRDVPDHKIYG